MIKKSIILSAIIFALNTISNAAFAQGDVSQLIQSGPEDAAKLAKAYLQPGFKGVGFGMNSAWFNSAKTKNLGRFDLKFQGTAAIVSASDRTFDISTLGLSANTRYNNANSITPTLFGENKTGAELTVYDDDNNEIGSFNLPGGTGINFVPTPQIQLTVGLIKNTDLSVRYTPEVGGNDFGKISSWGVGLKKEITSLLPGKSEKIIPVDIAVAFGYNQINYKYEVPEEEEINDGNEPGDLNQRVEAQFSGFTVDAILSKKLALFTPFVSVGYNTAKSELGLLGKYSVQTGYQAGGLLPEYETFTDPVKLNSKDIAGVRANIGFSLHLAIFRLYAAYSIGEYQAVTGGIGLGIGK